jgi:hypothetical protein
MNSARRLLPILGIVVSLHLNSSVGQDKTPSTTGKDVTDALTPVGGTTYHDDFAGLTLKVPPGAVVMAHDKVQDLAKESQKVVEERSSQVREAKKSGQGARTLFRLHLKRPATGTAAFLPGIAAWQEEIPKDAQGVTPERYLMNLRKAMQQASNIEYRKEIVSKKIDDLTFAFQVGQMEVKAGNQVITGIQEQHVVILRDRAIGFALTYNTAAEGESLRNIVWSLKLDKND